MQRSQEEALCRQRLVRVRAGAGTSEPSLGLGCEVTLAEPLILSASDSRLQSRGPLAATFRRGGSLAASSAAASRLELMEVRAHGLRSLHAEHQTAGPAAQRHRPPALPQGEK
eukprot:XP_024999085.1 uncharacterized protein LOC101747663 isoform X4 [Gallus gallus]